MSTGLPILLYRAEARLQGRIKSWSLRLLPHIFFFAQTRMSRLSTRDNLSESRYRAVQCCDDPTMAVVADLTSSED